MTLTRWQRSPLHRLSSLREEVDNLFNRAFDSDFDANGCGSEWLPAVDIYQADDNLIVRAELPGLKREDIDISLHEGALFISGERHESKKEESDKSHRTERVSGSFQRTISLPCKVDAGKIKATYTDGVLTTTLPKAEEAKPRQIPVNIQ
jgi:HSP20 family protein